MKLSISTLLSIGALLCTGIHANLTESDKSMLLSRHKNARNNVGASDMKPISWSDKLANEAQKYVNGCPGLTHSDRSSRNGQGENISYGGGSLETLFDLWTDEKSDFLKSNYASNFKGVDYNGKQIGHYSQVVWAENTEVGCGLANCNGSKNLVCRYKTGNTIGEKVYTISKEQKKEESKQESKQESKPTTTTVKKTTTTTVKKTTTTTTVKKTTTTTTVKKTTTTTTTSTTTTTTKVPVVTNQAVAPQNNINNNATKISSGKLLDNNKLPVTTTKVVQAVNSVVRPVATQASVVNQVVAEKPKESKKANDDKNSDKNSDKLSKSNSQEIQGTAEEEEENGSGSVVTGIALSGSVVGAAAVFAFVKKNPKQYKELKRNITRKATSIKRGASTVTRKLTTKRTTPPNINNNLANDYDFNYRANFADSLTV